MKTKRKQMKSKAMMYTLFIACCLMTVSNSFAQNVGISSTNAPPDNSAMLDVVATDRGMLIPRMTEAQRNAIVSPAEGLQIYNTTTKCFNFWIGNTWKQICGDCDFNSPIPGNNGPICQGSTLNLTATTILSATYQWSGPNGFTSTDQNPSIPTATAAASGSYSVTATKNGCTSTPQSTVATVNTTPVTPTAGNSGPVCVGALLNLTASTIVGATYNWTGPNGYSASVQNPIITSAALTHAGTYNVSATVNGCVSAAGTTSVTINSIPATPGSITGPSSACSNSTGNVYSISAVSGATSYNWTVPAVGTITANSGTSITVSYGTNPSGNVSVSAANICGTSGQSSLSISTNTICSPMTFNYTGSNQSFPVPSGITIINVKEWGGGGGGGCAGGWDHGYVGGGGGASAGSLTVTSGETLIIMVGAGGLGGCQGTSTSGNYGGGAPACPGNQDCQYGGMGGGRSAIIRAGADIMTAGGGGGGGSSNSLGTVQQQGGAGGGATAQDGSAYVTAARGRGATSSAGGAGGTGNQRSGGAGSQYLGGNSATQSYGGSGGGGYYGGGGGGYSEGPSHMGGAGGGSGYVTGTATTFTGSGQTPGNSTDTDRGTAGNGGGINTTGNAGLVIISW